MMMSKLDRRLLAIGLFACSTLVHASCPPTNPAYLQQQCEAREEELQRQQREREQAAEREREEAAQREQERAAARERESQLRQEAWQSQQRAQKEAADAQQRAQQEAGRRDQPQANGGVQSPQNSAGPSRKRSRPGSPNSPERSPADEAFFRTFFDPPSKGSDAASSSVSP